eukprot:TRINITY_DN6239_c0_g1_i2.p1 TRINITY_DN6239_c0_g1~~TRINITY_DN6239_c0_g1_i2.p1  ORF type:complete len:293 (+),score=50.28 TRINITY_DN6239_c0_g1_i2:140-1018(+)
MAVATEFTDDTRQDKINASALGIHVVVPGDLITTEDGFMRGHGTFQEGGKLYAAVAGVVERINKVVSVRPTRTRYVGEIGDVVVGRILEVASRRWMVDTQSRLNSVLKLSSVNLPGGVLRRKSATDELMMREFFREGDLISAEVQAIYQEDGTLSLHTRSLRYGKLGPGTFISVPSVLVKRPKHHFHRLPCGVALVLGNNGYIWMGSHLAEDTTQAQQQTTELSSDMRLKIARVHNCIAALAKRSLSIFDSSIIFTYEDSEPYEVAELLEAEILQNITARALTLCYSQPDLS